MNNEENKKGLGNFTNDAVDGKSVMGGGFGDGFVDDGSGNGPMDPFQAPAFNGPEDPLASGLGDMNPPVGPESNGPIGPQGPLDPFNGGPLGHGPH